MCVMGIVGQALLMYWTENELIKLFSGSAVGLVVEACTVIELGGFSAGRLVGTIVAGGSGGGDGWVDILELGVGITVRR